MAKWTEEDILAQKHHTQWLLEGQLQRQEESAATIRRRGAYAEVANKMQTIGMYALSLGQLQVKGLGDIEGARQAMSIPLGPRIVPSFVDVVDSVQQRIKAGEPIAGMKLSASDHLGAILCSLLVGELEKVAVTYAAFNDFPELFEPTEKIETWAVLTRHLVLAARGRADLIQGEAYACCVDAKVDSPMSAYPELLMQVAHSDERTFQAVLDSIAEAFARRTRARRTEIWWGYGRWAAVCFDSAGTAICRLARARGMQFDIPKGHERNYPDAFWRM